MRGWNKRNNYQQNWISQKTRLTNDLQIKISQILSDDSDLDVSEIKDGLCEQRIEVNQRTLTRYYFISIEYSFLKGYYVFTIYLILHSRSSSSSLASFITFVQKLPICPFVKVARISLIVLISSFEQSLIISPTKYLQIFLFITWNIISIGASWGVYGGRKTTWHLSSFQFFFEFLEVWTGLLSIISNKFIILIFRSFQSQIISLFIN